MRTAAILGILLSIAGMFTIVTLQRLREEDRCNALRDPLERKRLYYSMVWLRNCTGEEGLDRDCYLRATEVVKEQAAFDAVELTAQGCKP